MRQIISTESAPAAVGPYSQAILVEPSAVVFTAGQLGIDAKTGKLVEGGIQLETKQVLENLKAVVEAAGSNLQNVIKCTVFLSDIKDFQAMNAVYETYFPSNPPARSAIAVKNLPLNAKVEIEAVALVTT